MHQLALLQPIANEVITVTTLNKPLRFHDIKIKKHHDFA